MKVTAADIVAAAQVFVQAGLSVQKVRALMAAPELTTEQAQAILNRTDAELDRLKNED